MNYFTKIFIAVLAFTITFAYPSNKNKDISLYQHCFKPCPSVYLPVCGFDGQTHQEFASECVLDNHNCVLEVKKVRGFMKTVLEKCNEKQCSKICTKEYDPICGFNGQEYKTFSNKCIYKYHNCVSNNEWYLSKSEKCTGTQNEVPFPSIIKKCNKICTLDFSPVCGTDGIKTITYGNMCSYEVANCEANYKLRMLKTGEC